MCSAWEEANAEEDAGEPAAPATHDTPSFVAGPADLKRCELTTEIPASCSALRAAWQGVQCRGGEGAGGGARGVGRRAERD